MFLETTKALGQLINSHMHNCRIFVSQNKEVIRSIKAAAHYTRLGGTQWDLCLADQTHYWACIFSTFLLKQHFILGIDPAQDKAVLRLVLGNSNH